MKIRHNKKRNTAFIYESLIKEATAAVIKNDNKTKQKVVSILKKHFSEDSILKRHLDCYRSLYESRNLDKNTAEKILKEAKLAGRLLDTEGLFVSQSDLIKDVNTEFDSQFYNTFVPNYKTLASIARVFSNKTSPRNSVLLENQILDHMMSKKDDKQSITEPIDDIVLSSFVKKFNDKYEEELLSEQKELLTHYISSFADNSLMLKSFLNEEVSRLKQFLKKSISAGEIKEDPEMAQKTARLIEKLENLYSESINEESLLMILKTQSLVKEIASDADNT
jgi:hypothetical protein|tara:strand:- start:1557 stop:2393 length:837 start_codon:yes stop_codon:yes gene_type:complete